jgi:Lon protease-like protein
LRKYADGRMDILTRGRRRFEILLLNEERSFLRGAVEFFDDEEAAPPSVDARKQAIEGYNALQALSSNDPLDAGFVTEPQLSFRLAQPVADLSFRQVLLATRSEAERIRQLADFFPGFLARQQKIQHAKDVAPRNGHGRPSGERG